MTVNASQKRNQNIQNYVVLGLVAVVFLGLFYAAKNFVRKDPNVRSITYRLSGSATTIVVAYTDADGKSTKPVDAMLPWKKTLQIPRSTTVILTATNPTQSGTLKCQILIDGKEWKKDETIKSDRVSCAGIVP